MDEWACYPLSQDGRYPCWMGNSCQCDGYGIRKHGQHLCNGCMLQSRCSYWRKPIQWWISCKRTGRRCRCGYSHPTTNYKRRLTTMGWAAMYWWRNTCFQVSVYGRSHAWDLQAIEWHPTEAWSTLSRHARHGVYGSGRAPMVLANTKRKTYRYGNG